MRLPISEVRMIKKPGVWLALFATLLLSACGYTKIGRITSDPSRYRNRTVHVEGLVTNSFGALFAGGYQVQDDSGKIFVISNRGGPSRGSKGAGFGSGREGIYRMGPHI